MQVAEGPTCQIPPFLLLHSRWVTWVYVCERLKTVQRRRVTWRNLARALLEYYKTPEILLRTCMRAALCAPGTCAAGHPLHVVAQLLMT